MTRKKTKPQEPQCPDYIHSLPKELADLLHQKQEDRYSKYEAFRYLMEKQAVRSLEDSDRKLVPFTVAITQLATDWKWHRHTVSAFLDDLQVLDVLSVGKTREGFDICFTTLSFPSVA